MSIDFIQNAKKIVVIQADNPDADSLASSLALEYILTAQNKDVYLYCGTFIPTYLRYLPGWDRVTDELPKDFDASIIVDTSTFSLLENIQKDSNYSKLKAKPCLVIDHHPESQQDIPFATQYINEEAVASSEVIYELCKKNDWKISVEAAEMIMAAILSDSLGFTSEGTTAKSLEVASELVVLGASIPKIDADRRSLQTKSPAILSYKADLLKRVEYSDGFNIAMITIPWEEIEKYSPEYNPSALVIDEMRMVTGIKLSVAFKTYPDKKITAKIRANHGFPIASEVAKCFGGGGHKYAAGFKITDGESIESIKSKFINETDELIAKIENNNENTQYAYSVD